MDSTGPGRSRHEGSPRHERDIPPPLLVASISEAMSRRDGFNALQWLQNLQCPAPAVTGSTRLQACAGSAIGTSSPAMEDSHAPGLSDMDWGMRARRNSHSLASTQAAQQYLPSALATRAVTQLVQAGISGLEATSRPFMSAFTNGFLPAVTYVAIAQHRAVNQFMQRMRNGLARRNRSDDDSSTSPDALNGPRPYRGALRLYEAAVAKEKELQPEEAAMLFQQAFDADPRQAEWLSRLAKALSDQTYLDANNTSRVVDVNSRAIEVATRAMSMSPKEAHGYIARCVSRGRLALYSDNRTKVNLAAAAADDAKMALALEPQNDYAHHLMGRWHYEMASINAVVRTLVRFIFGATLMQGSYASALEHYKIAASLAPRTLVHRVEVGRTLAKLGHVSEAVQELETALELEVTDLNGQLQKEDAEMMVKRLRASSHTRHLLLPMGPTPAKSAVPSATVTVIDDSSAAATPK